MTTPQAALPRTVARRAQPPRALSLVPRHASEPDPMLRLREMRQQYDRIGALVEAAQLLDEVMLLVGPALARPEPTYCLRDAAAYTGHKANYLGRLVRAGEIPNHGHKHRPRIRLSDCPPRRRTRKSAGAP